MNSLFNYNMYENLIIRVYILQKNFFPGFFFLLQKKILPITFMNLLFIQYGICSKIYVIRIILKNVILISIRDCHTLIDRKING